MTGSSPEKWVFPMDCPDCKASSGYPYEAATIRGNVTALRLGLRCRECRREWKLDIDTDRSPDPPVSHNL